MTQVYVTGGIIAFIGFLVCYIFIKQTINERHKEKERLKRALVKKGKNLVQVLSAFPEQFLPKEIVIFIYRIIVDTYEQLTKLEPAEPGYSDAFKIHSAQMESISRKPENIKKQHFQSAAQINELRQYLTIVNKFCQKSTQRGQLTAKQGAHYQTLLKELTAHLAADNYMISAKQAKNNGKSKLAIHFYELAKELLLKETPGDYKATINEINEDIRLLQEEENAQQEAAQDHTPDQSGGDSTEGNEWAEFEEEDDWQKKNIYD